ncbi:tetratricopeptide repeat protein [Flavobacterium humi]|uniref:Tetratricopeptide repeat protein n=1 Tax=Flavobacterium humi TaxID=2562683 RepID=A0A4Z0LBH3_9FLAO|nr:tetratricopeptide repeat protein [Flavobacterium humi]TGD59066.1 tetratricopeptide repeat protein [Flavobacterium humi]
MRLYIKIVFTALLSFLVFANEAYGQNPKKLDSILKASASVMYENPDRAIAIGKEIVGKAGSNTDVKIRAYKLISDGYSSKRDYEKSLEYVIKANQLLPQTSDELLKIGIITKTGIQYHQLKIYDKAIQSLDQAEELCLEYPVRDSVAVNLGITYLVRGFIYKEKLNCEIAITFFDKGINEILKTKDLLANASKLSIAKYNKGNCYILMSDTKAAIESFQESVDYAKMVKANSLQAFAQKGLAQVYTLEGKYKQAIDLLQEALAISSNVNDLVLNQEIYKGLSENSLALNHWDNYQEYRLKYLENQSKLKNRERKSVSDSLKEKENEEKSKLEGAVSRYLSGIVIIFFVLLLIVVFSALSIRRSKASIEKLQGVVKSLQNENQ